MRALRRLSPPWISGGALARLAGRLLAIATILGLAVVAVQGLSGCSPKKKILVGNLPPETGLFVQGNIDTVNHRVHIYWFGSDVDGNVVAYRMRFVSPPPANQDPKWDTLYCALPGRCTDSLFTLFTGDSAAISPRFEIASIDDDGAIDPTPAAKTFLLSNQAPVVTILTPYGPADSTYASLTISWDTNDPDGGGPGLRYRVWLDGNEANYDSTTLNTFTVPSSRFLQNGTFTSGPRTVFVQAVDDGGRVGPASSMTWYVRAPAQVLRSDLRGEVLLIDEVPSSGSNNATFDAFYASVVQESLATNRYSVLKPQFNRRMFQSAQDFAQTLRQFKAVVWYRGIEVSISPLLQAYQDSLGAWLEAGGNLYLDGPYLISGLNSPGALRPDFMARHLGSYDLLKNFNSSIADSTVGWGNTGSSNFRSSVYGDAIRTSVAAPSIPGNTPGLRGFAVNDTNEVALWGFANQLSPQVPFEVPVGVTVAQPNGGRLVVLSVAVRLAAPATSTPFLRHMLYGRPGVTGVIRPNGTLLVARRVRGS